jgi:DNA-binding FadR family transcriptional regulator
MRPARLAELIAGDLRGQILRGDLEDGDRLPPLDRLVVHYDVSAPSIREALRVLETEGLITVRLGKLGGATVHQPRPERAAYMLGLVLESQQTRASDLAGAIVELALACVRTCARRPDRVRTVVPALREALGKVSRPQTAGDVATGVVEFHQRVVSECGNDSLLLIAGALEELWVRQGVLWPYREMLGPDDARRADYVIEVHERVVEAIEAGDPVEAASRLEDIIVDREAHPSRRRNPVVRADADKAPVPGLYDNADDG